MKATIGQIVIYHLTETEQIQASLCIRDPFGPFGPKDLPAVVLGEVNRWLSLHVFSDRDPHLDFLKLAGQGKQAGEWSWIPLPSSPKANSQTVQERFLERAAWWVTELGYKQAFEGPGMVLERVQLMLKELGPLLLRCAVNPLEEFSQPSNPDRPTDPPSAG